MTASTPTHVHLVGSVGLETVEDVFTTAGRLLGRRLKRVPDGEAGPRRLWVSFQYPFLRSSPYLRPDPSGELRKTSGFPKLCLQEGVADDEVTFPELGYARDAQGSYLDFKAAKARGDLPADARFQVCLPTPMGVIYAFCTTRNLRAIEAAYEKAMIREIALIMKHIPARDLAIQWDVCHELIMLDGQPQDHFPLVDASFAQIMARLARLAAAVPAEVELGIHLCYGDFGAKHFIEPLDAGKLVEMANGIAAAMPRRLQWIHMPVPVSRTDDAYFAPLAKLKLPPETELYLGLVHATDGVPGTQKRIEVASRYVQGFGIGTECGIARMRRPGLVRELLELHAKASAEPVCC